MKLINENINTLKNQISLTANYIKDKKGYVVYFEEFPDTFDQGKTKAEALKNLVKTLDIVLKYKRNNNVEEKAEIDSFYEEVTFQQI